MKLARRCGSSTVARALSMCVLIFAVSCSGTSSSTSQSGLVPVAGSSGSENRTAAERGALGFLSTPRAKFNAPLLPQAGTVYFGAFVNFLKMLPPFESQTATFEQEIGRKLAIHAEYYKWTDRFPNAQEIDDYNNGRIAIESWDCGDTNYNVANGKQDAVIKAHASAFKQYGHPVFIRWMWEMNLPYIHEKRPKCIDPNRDINGVFSPTDYVAAWQHIRAVFAAQGVTNVVWFWCPSGNVQVSPLPYYPGDTEVDWAGFDHYDVTGKVGLLNTLLLPYQTLVGLNKPLMVGETGTTAATQSSYLTDAPSVLQSNFPAILGFMYYNSYGTRQDWRLVGDGITAYATAGQSPYFQGRIKKGQ